MTRPVAWLYRNTDMGDQLSFNRLDHYFRPPYSENEHEYVKGVALVEDGPLLRQFETAFKEYDDKCAWARPRTPLGMHVADGIKLIVDTQADRIKELEAEVARLKSAGWNGGNYL
ncbi:hypothetical protein P6F34_gp25 [Pseudomonas phage MiCath]|uniref:Uncharacterized protein n=1 Tax=Pseudomonas phage MiCath TaxID=3003729 RepID=A0AAF0AGR6_9CAUD|nr:hypothetical protein P6F34_gp25 [Pseudomonas phage MiCath]WAX22378.1 hypothetical protein [Pseudomonas phage MiCath]